MQQESRYPTRPTQRQESAEDPRSVSDYVDRVMDTLQAQFLFGR